MPIFAGNVDKKPRWKVVREVRLLVIKRGATISWRCHLLATGLKEKGLHFCKPLIFLVPTAGFELAT